MMNHEAQNWISLARVLTIGFMMTISLVSCAPRGSSPYATPSNGDRNALKAQELTQQGVACMSTDPSEAEELLKSALAADIYFGPAHNNLGVLYLNQGQLYEAANEFEWARKLMPGHPDPRMNLGLTLEKAGKVEEALCNYGSALEVYPGHLPTMQALARLQIRRDRVDEQTKCMLQEIALAGETHHWREWAQQQLIALETKEKS